ncbi:MAG: hypothetical protein FJW26_22245 [Acidimicrobiia bacterium]|nr:hypothetical protein [Acidimicrobiia bacterium]
MKDLSHVDRIVSDRSQRTELLGQQSTRIIGDVVDQGCLGCETNERGVGRQKQAGVADFASETEQAHNSVRHHGSSLLSGWVLRIQGFAFGASSPSGPATQLKYDSTTETQAVRADGRFAFAEIVHLDQANADSIVGPDVKAETDAPVNSF